MRATEEQQAIAGTELAPGDLFLVNAYAGCAKTTTQQIFAEAHPNERMLYLCYNKDLQLEARGKFPRNVDCMTIHSMAYRSVGSAYRHKLGNLRVVDLVQTCDYTPRFASAIIKTINRFVCSSDKQIHSEHFPELEFKDILASEVLGEASRVWKKMCDVENTLAMTHDGYLKLWSLDRNPLEGYRYVLLDEAQDSNPVTQDFVMRVARDQSAAVLMVGDTHQSIYGFRQATDALVNCMDMSTHRASLTTCFRCTQDTMDMASKVLNDFKGDPVRITGAGIKPLAPQSKAFIARNNSTLIAQALEAHAEKRKVYFAGTNERDKWNPWVPYRFQDTLDLFYLSVDEKSRVQSPSIKKFKDWNEAKEIGEVDPEIGVSIKLVDLYADGTPSLLNRIAGSAVGPKDADISLATAHRSKGREWDEVELANDFFPIYDAAAVQEMKADFRGLQDFIQEVNLIYVALTRSRGDVKLVQEMQDYLRPAQSQTIRRARV